MVMANSEFTMKKFTKADTDKTIELTGVTATMNADFMAAIKTDNYFKFSETFYATF